MRSAQKSNRSRGRGNRKGGNSGGNNINRVFDSAGPEGKVRGTPQQIIDKYLSLARDAQTSGDRVAAENFLQHAEHYQRILIQANATQEQARREAQEAATDQAPDRGNEAMAQPTPAAVMQPQPQAQQPHTQQPQPQGMPQPVLAADAAPIGGMTTIDSPAPEPALLVDGEETAKSQPQPRRNGDGRTRRPRQKAEAPKPAPEEAAKPAPAAAEPAEAEQAEAASTSAEG
ncbi:MAG: DUF4167 domain-containing protein [Pseudomonadota bacterium]